MLRKLIDVACVEANNINFKSISYTEHYTLSHANVTTKMASESRSTSTSAAQIFSCNEMGRRIGTKTESYIQS